MDMHPEGSVNIRSTRSNGGVTEIGSKLSYDWWTCTPEGSVNTRSTPRNGYMTEMGSKLSYDWWTCTPKGQSTPEVYRGTEMVWYVKQENEQRGKKKTEMYSVLLH